MYDMICAYWKDVLAQDRIVMKTYFTEDAFINWHNTNEHFTVEEFICANCEYPGEWSGDIVRYQRHKLEVSTVVHVYTKDNSLSFHVTSFIQLNEEAKIISIDEYWGEDGAPPQWRQDKHIGTHIQ